MKGRDVLQFTKQKKDTLFFLSTYEFIKNKKKRKKTQYGSIMKCQNVKKSKRKHHGKFGISTDTAVDG